MTPATSFVYLLVWQLAPFHLKSTGADEVPAPMKPNERLPPWRQSFLSNPAGLLAVMALPVRALFGFRPLLNASPEMKVHLNVYPEPGIP
jgi:hypothetical protein